MKANRRVAALLAVCLAACTLSGCGEKIKKFFAHDGTYVEESSDAAEESSIAETEPAATEPAETKPIETETNAVTDPITTTTETIVSLSDAFQRQIPIDGIEVSEENESGFYDEDENEIE